MEATDLGPLFRPLEDPGHPWLLASLVALLALVALAAWLARRRLPAARLLAVMLLPAGACAAGSLVALEASKQVAFCGSCHATMGPLVRALEEDGASIASRHWRTGAVSRAQACYQCHGGYGLWGDLAAKRAGLEHVARAVTGRYQLPIRTRRFDVRSCLGCHASTEPFRAVASHRDRELQRELLAGEAGCTGSCHEVAHPESALWGLAGPPAAGTD